MTRQKSWAVMLVLIFGMTVVGCDGGDDFETVPDDFGTVPDDYYSFLPGSVSITGNPYVGQTLTANTDSLGGSGAISYQWISYTPISGGYYIDSDIANATGKNYTLIQTDLNNYIAVAVTRPSHYHGTTSARIGPVTAGVPLTGTVSITGTAQVGQTLTANTNSLNGTGNISYQWKRGTSATVTGTNITDATGSTYTLVTADATRFITVTVTRADNSGSVTSTATSAIEAAPALTGTVSITGTAKIGQTLTANTANLGGSGTISYQWRRAASSSYSDITGANENTYLLTTDDFNRYIVVVVTRAGNSGNITSAATSAVADVMTWTQVSQSVFTSTTAINKVAHDGNSRFIAAGGSILAGSSDGTTWPTSDYTTGRPGNSIAYGNGKWIAVGSNGSMNSSNTGQAPWSTISASSISSIFGFIQDGNQYYRNIDGIAYGNGRWIVFGSGNMGTSTDGTNWTLVTQPLMTITDVAYGNNRWIAVGNRDMITSTDGTNWTPVDVSSVFPSSGSSISIKSVAYANNLWITAGTGGRIATSTNGVNWTLVPNNPFGTGTIQALSYGNNKWIAVGSETSTGGVEIGSRIAFSSDGITWTSVANTAFDSNRVNSVVYGSGKWVAVGNGGRIAYANDN